MKVKIDNKGRYLREFKTPDGDKFIPQICPYNGGTACGLMCPHFYLQDNGQWARLNCLIDNKEFEIINEMLESKSKIEIVKG
jgi:hypothetical protein